MLVDTHCHIHEADYPLDSSEVLAAALGRGVSKIICVGTDLDSSERAVDFANNNQPAFASIGIHPHNTKDGDAGLLGKLFSRVTLRGASSSPVAFGLRSHSVAPQALANSLPNKPARLVAIGEIGLDYYYNHSPREVQIRAFEAQLQLAVDNNLPVIFHVREAFEDFWPIIDSFGGKIRGVLHSFTDSKQNAEIGIGKGLFIGVNGISTFTKDSVQMEMFEWLPVENMLIETDAPFLTPAPFRGKVNQPAFAREVAEYHAKLRGISLDELCSVTTKNAELLFGI